MTFHICNINAGNKYLAPCFKRIKHVQNVSLTNSKTLICNGCEKLGTFFLLLIFPGDIQLSSRTIVYRFLKLIKRLSQKKVSNYTYFLSA